MKQKGLLFAFVTMIISGFAVFLNARMVAGMDAIVQTTLKNGLVGLMIVGLLLARRKQHVFATMPLTDWKKLTLIALLGGSISFGLFFSGLKIIGATDGALIHKTLVLWVTLLAIPFLKEKISLPLGLVAVGLYGVNFIGGNTFSSLTVAHGMVLAATLMWSVETILVKRWLRFFDPDVLLFGRMVMGSVFLAAYMFMTGKAGLVLEVTLAQWGGLAVVSLLLFGYVTTWYRALRLAPASAVAAILVGSTVITTTLSSVAGGAVTSIQVIQAVLISGLLSILVLWLERGARKSHNTQTLKMDYR